MPKLDTKVCRSYDKIARQEAHRTKINIERIAPGKPRGEWHGSIPLVDLNLQPEFTGEEYRRSGHNPSSLKTN
jgi:hypothetical protein